MKTTITQTIETREDGTRLIRVMCETPPSLLRVPKHPTQDVFVLGQDAKSYETRLWGRFVTPPIFHKNDVNEADVLSKLEEMSRRRQDGSPTLLVVEGPRWISFVAFPYPHLDRVTDTDSFLSEYENRGPGCYIGVQFVADIPPHGVKHETT